MISLGDYKDYFIWLSVASVIFLLIAAFLMPYVIGMLPSDYFEQNKRPHHNNKHPLIILLGKGLKNALGLLILLMGIIMLITPGQGLLSIVVGLLLLDYPGKYRFEQKLMRAPYVLASVNWVRRKQGKKEFRV